MIGQFITLEIFPGRESEFLVRIAEVVQQSRQEPGVVQFDLFRDEKARSTFYLMEVFRDDDSLESHWKTPHFLAFQQHGAGLIQKKTKAKMEKIPPMDRGHNALL